MLELVVRRLDDAAGTDLEQPRPRVRHQHRGVGRHQELRATLDGVLHQRQQRQLPQRREGRLGLVEHVQPRAREATSEERQVRFAVRPGA